jgi:hypothetical protein
MKPKSIQLATCFSLSALTLGVLTACGGGGSASLDIADGGIRGTGSSVGPVSGFGSVFVNGVRFDTSDLNGQVRSDDGITAESELEEGMILRVDGEWRDDGTGTADALEYDDTLRGQIEGVLPDPSGAGEFVEIVVMGQTVVVEKKTVVRGTTFANLLSGNGIGLSVRVSAWRQEDGSFRASYIGILAQSTEEDVEVEGAIEEDSVQPGGFTLNGVNVTYGSNVEFGEGLGVSDLIPGSYFEVEGDYSSGTLHARQIERDDFRRYIRASDDDIEFTSPIQVSFSASGSGAQAGEFRMSDLVVRVTDETELDGGLTVADLQQGTLVQVEGEFRADGTVVADEIELREGHAEVAGTITSMVDRTARTFEVGGVLVQVTPLTIITDDDDNTRISLEDLFSGDEVEVEGVEREDDSGAIFLEALKVEREEPEGEGDEQSEFELEGKLRAIDAQSITVLGVRMSIGIGAFEGNTPRSDIERMVSPQTGEFPLVEVEYSLAVVGQDPFRADEIELEEDDDD